MPIKKQNKKGTWVTGKGGYENERGIMGSQMPTEPIEA